MLDLDETSVRSWIKAHQPDAVAFLRSGLAVDDLTTVSAHIVALGHTLDGMDPALLVQAMQRPEVCAALQRVLAQLSPLRQLRVLGWLATLPTPDRHLAMQGLWSESTDPEACRVVREGVEHMHRALLMQRIFSPDRVEALLTLCQGDETKCEP